MWSVVKWASTQSISIIGIQNLVQWQRITPSPWSFVVGGSRDFKIASQTLVNQTAGVIRTTELGSNALSITSLQQRRQQRLGPMYKNIIETQVSITHAKLKSPHSKDSQIVKIFTVQSHLLILSLFVNFEFTLYWELNISNCIIIKHIYSVVEFTE